MWIVEPGSNGMAFGGFNTVHPFVPFCSVRLQHYDVEVTCLFEMKLTHDRSVMI